MERGFREMEGENGRERQKNTIEKLNEAARFIASDINREAEQKYGIKGLLNTDASISMESFAEENGGIYPRQEIEDDEDLNYQNEVSNAGVYNLPLHSPEQKAKIAEWKQARERSRANQIEIAITALFYKILKNEFIVVRSSERDDNQASVDNLLVNRITGEVLCAIDDVHTDNSGRTDQDPNRNKGEKMQKIALKGGVEVKYGLNMEQGKLQRAHLRNVPVFYLGLTNEQFTALTSNFDHTFQSPVSPVERQIFSQLVTSIESQKKTMDRLALKTEIKQNLSKLEPTIERLKQFNTPEIAAKAA